MGFYALTGLINGIVATTLGLFIYSRSKRSLTNQTFGLFCLSVSVWSYSYFLWQISITEGAALFWSRGLMAGAIFITVSYFHFILSFLKKVEEQKKVLIFGYLASIFFFLANFTSYFIKGVSPKLGFPYWPDPGILYHPFLVLWIFYAAYSVYLLVRQFPTATRVFKHQIKYILVGTVVGYLGGITNYFLWYDFPIPPIGNWTTTLYLIIVAYTILRYHLLNIRVILTEILVGFVGLILLIEALLFPTILLKALGFGLLILFGIVGYFLIKSVLKEITLRTELQKATKDLKRAYDNIEVLSEMKSEFLKVVNHQLRTPVSIVKGMLSMMMEGSVKKGRQKEFIKKAYLSSERLTTILDDILLAQSLVGGGERVELSSCQIEEIIERQVEHFNPQIEIKGLEIIFEKPKEPLPITFADSEMIGRAVARLIDNAILYTEKGKIVVSAKLEKEGEKEFVEISVKDSGIGLSKAEKKNLFKLFYRGEEATSLHPNGSGLGLFIVKNLAEIHQGKINVKSAGRGKGATFIITLPILTEV
jgi:signal transduction histidine kinase